MRQKNIEDISSNTIEDIKKAKYIKEKELIYTIKGLEILLNYFKENDIVNINHNIDKRYYNKLEKYFKEKNKDDDKLYISYKSNTIDSMKKELTIYVHYYDDMLHGWISSTDTIYLTDHNIFSGEFRDSFIQKNLQEAINYKKDLLANYKKINIEKETIKHNKLVKRLDELPKEYKHLIGLYTYYNENYAFLGSEK